jgi:sporulation protein YlmC with PRC-barrel domain
MNLIRLKRHQHPRPPQRELRQHNVFDSRGRFVGEVANLYVDEDRELHFVDVVTGASWVWERSTTLSRSKP